LGDVSDFNTCPETITRTYQISDESGNSATCVQTIVIDDTTGPTLTCPASPQVRALGQNETEYTAIGGEFDPVVLSDNCGAPMAVNNLNGTGTLDGYVFPIGDTEVIWTATDACGNMVTCSFTVSVIAYPCVEIQAWVYLEGAAISTDGSPNYTLPMRTSLNDLQILPGQ